MGTSGIAYNPLLDDKDHKANPRQEEAYHLYTAKTQHNNSHMEQEKRDVLQSRQSTYHLKKEQR